MAVSVFDLYKIGIGPSSSHTVGPMRAAARFVEHHLAEAGKLGDVARVRAEVFGSLALTGRGHGTDKAVLMGLEGHWPDRIDPDLIPAALERIRGQKRIRLHGAHEIGFDEKSDLVMNKRQKLPFHTNGMRFTAYDAAGEMIATRDYYSVGGGFVVNQDEAAEDRIVADTTPLAHPFHSGDALLARCAETGLSIARIMLENERAWRSDEDTFEGLREIWRAMSGGVDRGIRQSGTLPGGLHVSRRAPALYAELCSRPDETPDPRHHAGHRAGRLRRVDGLRRRRRCRQRSAADRSPAARQRGAEAQCPALPQRHADRLHARLHRLPEPDRAGAGGGCGGPRAQRHHRARRAAAQRQ